MNRSGLDAGSGDFMPWEEDPEDRAESAWLTLLKVAGFLVVTGIVALMFLALLTPRVRAGWGGGASGPVGPSYQPLPLPAPTFAWSAGVDPDQVHLFLGGHQIGTWRHDLGAYYAFDGREWRSALCPVAVPAAIRKLPEPAKAPAAAPCCDLCGKSCPCQACDCGKEKPPRSIGQEAPAYDPNGVDRSNRKASVYSIKGRMVSEREAFEAVAKGDLADDSGKPWLAVVAATDSEAVALGKKVLGDLEAHPALSAYKGHFRVQPFGLDTFQAKDHDGKQIYLPGITVVLADHRPVHYQEAYDPARLAVAVGELRKASPDYDPTKVPDLSRLPPTIAGIASAVPTPAIALGRREGGGIATITGTNLTGATSIKFGVAEAQLLAPAVLADRIMVLVPPGQGQVDVRVTTPVGVSPAYAFKYDDPPAPPPPPADVPTKPFTPSDVPVWVWIGGGLAVLAGLYLRNRNLASVH
jgi:hypothetical protein